MNFKKKINVGIIGGGWAGLSAATELVSQGIPVTVLESSATLGGRARVINWSDTPIDNGLHVLMGAYKETLRKIAMVSEEHSGNCLLRLPLTFDIRPNFYFTSGTTNYPLNLILGLIRTKGLNNEDKIKICYFMLSIKRIIKRPFLDNSVKTLLERYKQTENAIKYLWEPICLAALNTPIREASAKIFISVVQKTILSDSSASQILIPTEDLSQIFPTKAKKYIEKKGSQIKFKTRVETIKKSGELFEINNNRNFCFSHVIVAVSPHHVKEIISSLSNLKTISQKIETLDYQPITSIYLQYPTSVKLPRPMIGIENSLCHWVFDRGIILGQHGLLGVVISGPGAHQNVSNEQLANIIHNDLNKEFGLPNYKKYIVIREKRATVKSAPNRVFIDNLTPEPRLYIAGDYTEADYPATLEASVISGSKCAQLVKTDA